MGRGGHGSRIRYHGRVHGARSPGPLGSPSDVPEDAHAEGLQVLRRHHRTRAGARRHRRGGAQRVGQVQRRRRHRLGARRPGAVQRCARRRWTTSSSPAPRSARRSAAPRSPSRSTTRRACCPIEFTEVTLTRTLFRTGDSEYAINGVPCRLLDIQELLSDTGVGRQQHVIVSQGQIDAVLNARPEDRRLIIEEAAGILKYRKRKEKAERRLAATEGNLTRLGDLLREVRRQLRPLERQADAARRHGDLVAELRALQVFLAGRELTTLTRRLADGAAARAELATEDNLLRRTLAELDTAVLAAEAELGHAGGDDLGDALVRFESLREKARGLAAVLAERRRGIDRERGAFVDQAVIATLEAEATRLAAELADADAETAALAPAARRAGPRRGRARRGPDRLRARLGRRRPARSPGAPPRAAASWRPCARASSAARRSWRAPRPASPRSRRSSAASTPRPPGCAPRPTAAEAAEAPARRAARAPPSRQRAAAEQQVADAEAALRAADGDRHAWTARAEALSLALDEARARAGAERLASVDGVVGTLLDLVEIDPGWEAAVEAAAGEALAAVVVDGVDAARRAVAALHADGDDAVGGAVLALGAAARPRPAPPIGDAGARARARRPRRRRARCSTRCSAAPSPSTAGGPPPSTPRWRTPTPSIVTRDGGRFGATRLARRHRVRRRHRRRPRGGTRAGRRRPPRPRRTPRRACTAPARCSTRRARLEAALSRQLDELDAPAHRRHRRASSGSRPTGATPPPRPTPCAPTPTSSASGWGASRRGSPSSTTTLPILEAEEADTAERARAMADAKAHLEERAAAVGSLRADLEVRSAGSGRAPPVPARPAGSRSRPGSRVRSRPAARPRCAASSSTPSRPPSTTSPPWSPTGSPSSRASSASCASAVAARARPSAPPPSASTSCAASARTPSDASRRRARRLGAPSSTRPR